MTHQSMIILITDNNTLPCSSQHKENGHLIKKEKQKKIKKYKIYIQNF